MQLFTLHFLYTAIVAILTNALPLLLWQVGASLWLVAVSFWAIFLVFYWMPILHVTQLISGKQKTRRSAFLLFIVDWVLGYSFLLAGVWASIFALIPSQFMGLPAVFSAYGDFYNEFWIGTVFALTGNTPALGVRAVRFFSRLWEVLINFHGIVLLGIVVSIFGNLLQRVYPTFARRPRAVASCGA